jgi:tetratricopeptide (TPR) repeat protein
MLTIYRQIYQGREVLDDERSQEKNTLKLVGLVKSEHGHLEVCNEIYRQVFDLEWIKANIVVDWTRRLAIITTLVALVLTLTLGGYVWWQAEAPARAYEANFTNTTNPTLRLNALANLFTLPEYGSQARAVLGLPSYDDRARTLFKGLSLEEEIELFTRATPDLQPQVREVVRGTYTYLEDTEANNRLLQTMQAALNQSEDAESKVLANEITRWLAGRTATTLEEKKSAYSDAINWNDENPAIYFERALILTALNDNEGALTDFETVLGLDIGNEWDERVQQAIEGNSQLYMTLWRERATYPELVGVVPTPTPKPTSTPQQLPTTSIPTPFQMPDIPDFDSISLPTPFPTIPSYLLTPFPTLLPDYLLDPPFIVTPIRIPDIHPIPTPIHIPDLRPISIPIRVPGSGPVSIPTQMPAEPAPNFSVPP